MSIKPISSSVNCTLTKIGQRARLPVAIAGVLLSAQSQAFLPTPLSIMTTGELADNSTPELVTALQQNVVTAKAIAPLSSNVQTDAQKPPNSAGNHC